MCVCVCFGSKCLTFFLIRDVFESLKYFLDLWLSSMFDCIHICVFLFFENMILSNLDSFSIPLDNEAIYRAFLTSFLNSCYRNLNPSGFLRFNLDSYSIHRGSFWMLNRCSIAPQSIEPLLLRTPLDRSSIDAR